MPKKRANVSLEELLRAKREEKPNEAFWVGFDRELKSKQRRLVQKQIVSDDSLRAPFATRVYRFSAFGSAIGFAAIALYFTVGPQVQDRNSVATAPVPAAVEQPSFTVANTPAPTATARTSEGLQEFAAVAPTARRRIVVESVNPASVAVPVSTAPAQLAATSSSARIDRQGLKLEFLDATGLFDDPSIALTDTENTELLGVRGFEQAYTLGKYADPLGSNGFDSTARNASALQIQTVNTSRIDQFLSSQSSRTNRSLDTVTLRF